MRRILITMLVGVALLLPSVAGASQSLTPTQQDRIDALFKPYTAAGSPGCEVGIIENGVVTFSRSYGLASIELNKPIDRNTVFDIASMSKQFTAASILLLAQRSKLSLDDDVRTFLPQLNLARRITVRQLLHHTSGLRDYIALFQLTSITQEAVVSSADVTALLARQKELNFEPGKAFSYSNSGYFILGEIVRKVSGKSLAQFARNEIFLPLGMTHTQFLDNHARVIPARAGSYVRARGGNWEVSSSNWEDMGPGGVQTTLDDLARWDAEFYRAKVLGKGVIDGLQTPGRLTTGEELAYASGLVIERYRGVRRIQHAGGTSGYRAMLARYPDQATSIILLCNADNANPYLLTDQITDIALERQLSQPEPSLARTSATLPVGLYWSPTDDEYQQVSLDDGVIRFGPPGTPGVVLDLYDDGVFRKRPRTTQTFRLGTASPPRLLVRDGTGHEQVFQRVDHLIPSPAELADFVGHYTSDEVAAHFDVSLTDGRLVVHLGGSDPLLQSEDGDEVLVPTSKDAFSIGGLGVRFLREHGQVVAMTISPSRAARVRFTKSLVN